MIYEKSLKLSSESKKKYSQGEIINLISVDAEKFDDAAFTAHYLWTSPLAVIGNVL